MVKLSVRRTPQEITVVYSCKKKTTSMINGMLSRRSAGGTGPMLVMSWLKQCSGGPVQGLDIRYGIKEIVKDGRAEPLFWTEEQRAAANAAALHKQPKLPRVTLGASQREAWFFVKVRRDAKPFILSPPIVTTSNDNVTVTLDGKPSVGLNWTLASIVNNNRDVSSALIARHRCISPGITTVTVEMNVTVPAAAGTGAQAGAAPTTYPIALMWEKECKEGPLPGFAMDLGDIDLPGSSFAVIRDGVVEPSYEDKVHQVKVGSTQSIVSFVIRANRPGVRVHWRPPKVTLLAHRTEDEARSSSASAAARARRRPSGGASRTPMATPAPKKAATTTTTTTTASTTTTTTTTDAAAAAPSSAAATDAAATDTTTSGPLGRRQLLAAPAAAATTTNSTATGKQIPPGFKPLGGDWYENPGPPSRFFNTKTGQNTEVPPTCVLGLALGTSCCAQSCGKCGGQSCGAFPGGASRCCAGAIQRRNRRCVSPLDVGCVFRARPGEAKDTRDQRDKRGRAKGRQPPKRSRQPVGPSTKSLVDVSFSGPAAKGGSVIMLPPAKTLLSTPPSASRSSRTGTLGSQGGLSAAVNVSSAALLVQHDCLRTGSAIVRITIPVWVTDEAMPQGAAGGPVTSSRRRDLLVMKKKKKLPRAAGGKKGTIHYVSFSYLKTCKGGLIPGFDMTFGTWMPGVFKFYAVHHGVTQAPFRASRNQMRVREAEPWTHLYLQQSLARTTAFLLPKIRVTSHPQVAYPTVALVRGPGRMPSRQMPVGHSALLRLIHVLSGGSRANKVEIAPEVVQVEYNCIESGLVTMTAFLQTVRVSTGVDGTEYAMPDKSLAFSWTKACHVPLVAGLFVGSDRASSADAVRATRLAGLGNVARHALPLASRDVVSEGRPGEAYHVDSHSHMVKGSAKEASFWIHLQRNDSVLLLPPSATTNNKNILGVTLAGPASVGAVNLSLATSPLRLTVRFDCHETEDGGSPVVRVTLPISAPGEATSDLEFAFVKRCWGKNRLKKLFKVHLAESWANVNFAGAATFAIILVACMCHYARKRNKRAARATKKVPAAPVIAKAGTTATKAKRVPADGIIHL
eukprot:g2908.t1